MRSTVCARCRNDPYRPALRVLPTGRWGLRDYGTATWEGGDSECDHQRQSAVSRASSGLDGATTTQGGAYAFGAECGRCGAKRIDSQLGLEPTPEQYVENLVRVFREVRRVLRDDGTVWLNLGDSYAGAPIGSFNGGGAGTRGRDRSGHVTSGRMDKVKASGLKPKDLVGIPWRVAFALQADGWWLRSDIIWAKPNPMPESVTDRPTRAHEYVFLLTKSARYFYDADAIREDGSDNSHGGLPIEGGPKQEALGQQVNGRMGLVAGIAGRNKRSVWTVTTQPYPEAHFATFPPKLVEPCVLAGSPPKCCGECGASWERVTESGALVNRGKQRGQDAWTTPQGFLRAGGSRAGDVDGRSTIGWRPTCSHDGPHENDVGRCTILDPFCGSGTTGLVALRHNRSFIGIELNSTYAEMARNRIRDDAPLMNHGSEVAA
jgi:DNA modification methylase